MPIVDIEFLTNTIDAAAIDKESLQRVTDELGELFGSVPGGTWVRLCRIDPNAYAENGTAVESQAAPVFVSVLRADVPEATTLRREMAGVADIVSRALGHPRENVHVLYAPGARGRIGFGGVLMA